MSTIVLVADRLFFAAALQLLRDEGGSDAQGAPHGLSDITGNKSV